MLSFIAAFEQGDFKDVVCFGTNSWSKFVIAAYNGDEKTLEAILKTNFSDVNRQNKVYCLEKNCDLRILFLE